MIALRRMNGQEIVINADLIESIESTPDTMITLTSGKKMMVQNKLEDIVRKAVKYKQLTYQTIRLSPQEPPLAVTSAKHDERSS